MMNNLVYLPVSEMARLISQKRVSPVELAEAHLDRIKAVQPRVNAFITILEQEALRAQSANIQGVSGASYTSAGFAQSLQSALHSLGM